MKMSKNKKTTTNKKQSETEYNILGHSKTWFDFAQFRSVIQIGHHYLELNPDQ